MFPIKNNYIPPAVPSHQVITVQPENTTLATVNTLIEYLPKLPGAGDKASPEQIAQHRQNLHNCLSELDSTGRWMRDQGNAVVRPVAVGMQAIVEHALLQDLAQNKIKDVSVIFTTQYPPTPLCSEINTLSTSLATPDVINSPGSYDTVISRQASLRSLIDQPGVDTWALYTKIRDDAGEQKIFDTIAASKGDRFHAINTNSELPESLSGATYVITALDGQKSVLGIRITQANEKEKQCVLFTEKGGQKELKDLHNYIAQLPPQNQVSLPEELF